LRRAAGPRGEHDFVDLTLDRAKPKWGVVPNGLIEQAEHVWDQVTQLAATPDAPPPEVATRMDELRATYTEYYTEAESVAWSSVSAAKTKNTNKQPVVPKPQLPIATRRVLRLVPERVRHFLPRKTRKRIVRAVVKKRR